MSQVTEICAVEPLAFAPESCGRRTHRDLLIASRQYAAEVRWQSWWHLLSTLTVLLLFFAVAGWGPNLWIRLAGSVVLGLTIVRMFILYHDYLHHAIFRDSWFAGALLRVYGYLILTAPDIWKESHDYHHHHNSKMFGLSIGSFPLMTKQDYQSASRLQRLEYRIARSPWTIVMGYFTVFLFRMCIMPIFFERQRGGSALLSMVIHYGFIAGCVYYGGWTFALLTFVLPISLAMALGSYLFYIQHNFPDARMHDDDDWTLAEAALGSSSYLETGVILRWFTGNIGYHHIHHLNAKIPFYRLPEAMAGLEELQQPGKTSLRLGEIFRCLRLNLWDEEREQFVSFASLK